MRPDNKWREWFFVLCVLVGNSFFLNFNAFRSFNSYDLSFALDGGWRIVCGQKPFVDFVSFLGPIYFYAFAFFVWIFGFCKTAVLAHLIFSHSIAIVLGYLIARRYLSFWLSCLLTLLTTTSFYWSISFPWHDHTAHLFGILALYFFIKGICSNLAKDMSVAAVSGGCFSVLSTMTKTNIGLAYFIMFFVVFLGCQKRKKLFFLFFGGVFLGTLISKLFIADVGIFLQQMVDFLKVASQYRVIKPGLPNPFVNYYWIPFGIVFAHLLSAPKKFKQWVILLVSFYMAIMISIWTSGIIDYANIFMWGIFMTVVFIIFTDIKPEFMRGIRRYIYEISFRALIIMVIAMIGLAVRDGINLKVWAYTGKNPVGDYALKAKPFEGWLFHRRQGVMVDEMYEFIVKNIPKKESLFIATDLTFLYGLTGRESYRNVAIATMCGLNAPPSGKSTERMIQTLKENPPDWIITDLSIFMDEMPHFQFQGEIMKNYVVVADWRNFYRIYRRKAASLQERSAGWLIK